MRKAPTLSLAGLVLAVLCAPASAGAQERDGFRLRLDPLLVEPIFTEEDSDSAKFEEYRDMDSGIVVPLLRVEGVSADGNRWLELVGENVSRDDARYRLDYGLAGRYRLEVDHNVIPHRFGNDATLFHERTREGVYEIADPIQAALQERIEEQGAIAPSGVNFAFLSRLVNPYLEASESFDLALERNRTAVRFDFAKQSPLAWGLEVKTESRSGSRPYGAAFGFSNAIELPEPIDYDTTSAAVSGEWSGERGGASFGYRLSSFENHVDSLLYDNPFRVEDATDPNAYQAPGASSRNGAATGRNALAPDNLENRLHADASWKVGERGWVRGGASYAVMRQDEELLPYSTNSAIDEASGAPFDVTDPDNLPARAVDAEARAFHLSASAGTELGERTTVTARFRRYDYDNETSRIEFPGYVRFDAVWEPIPRVNVPYAYTRCDLGLELQHELGSQAQIELRYRREQWDRELREIEDAHEDAVRVAFDGRLARQVLVRASAEAGKRSTDEYHVEAQELSFLEPEGPNNLPTLRKFDEAERDFHVLAVSAQLLGSDSVDVWVGASRRRDDYDESRHGLASDELWQVGFEVGYAPREELSLYVFGNRADRELFQRGRQSGAAPSTDPAADWDLTLTEDTDTWGAGLTATLGPRLTANLEAQLSNADGKSDFVSPPGGTPDLAFGFDEYDDNELLALGARLDYRLSDHVHGGAWYRHEEYEADRFARTGLQPYLPGTFLLDANDGDYDAEVFAFFLRLRY